ncbi:MAG: alpha-amlyase [Bacteroidetes bacterium 4572_77]|nr:MAG: alpha-amlyase [Bacteroidetes bacterium 4572_77]
MYRISLILVFALLSQLFATAQKINNSPTPFNWHNASVYFLLTDRFNNADTTNDINFNRNQETAHLRGFEGGDIKGITAKIQSQYFQRLGIDVIWFSPVVEQIHGYVDEGQGKTYGYHGYWPRDWTAMEPNFGTPEDLRELIKLAHQNNIRIMMDVIINHTGPVTEKDPVWPSDWVRTKPQCTYQDAESTISCTLVKNLPDILTNQTQQVELPAELQKKWETEGRLQSELAELDAFFARTGYPKTPRYYIIKWLTDFIREFGIDGFRVDTVKHTEADVWDDLGKEAQIAFEYWKKNNSEAIQENQDFFMMGEVYNYNLMSGPLFDFGDRKVNYYENGFHSLINFGFKSDAYQEYEELFSSYSNKLKSPEFKGITVMNYISSHDDGFPFDKNRNISFRAANMLMLSPGMAQIYYGDEVDRPLEIKGANGDANLRGMMIWNDTSAKDILTHYQKLGTFRKNHSSIGAGEHRMISEKPYAFVRSYVKGNVQDRVLIALDLPKEKFRLNLRGFYADGDLLFDKYENKYYQVVNGSIDIHTNSGMVLIEQLNK